MSTLKTIIHRLGRLYVEPVNKHEYKNQQLHINERPVEYRFVFEHLSRVFPDSVLDVGSGRTAFPAILRQCGFKVTAIDNIKDYWPKGMFNRHFYVRQDDIRNTALSETFDFINCVSVMEHIPEHRLALKSMFKLLNPGGHIALTFPYNETKYIENAYKLPDAGYGQDHSYVCQIFSREQVDEWLEENNGTLVEQEYWRLFSGDYWTVGERLAIPRQVSKDDQHDLSCLLIKQPKEPKEAK